MGATSLWEEIEERLAEAEHRLGLFPFRPEAPSERPGEVPRPRRPLREGLPPTRPITGPFQLADLEAEADAVAATLESAIADGKLDDDYTLTADWLRRRDALTPADVVTLLAAMLLLREVPLTGPAAGAYETLAEQADFYLAHVIEQAAGSEGIRIEVEGQLPPKKDGANSMWRKPSERQRLIALRRAAAEQMAGRPPWHCPIALDLVIHAAPAAGDLDNFITGVCDGLTAAHRGVSVDGEACDDLPVESRFDRPIAFTDDAQVQKVTAERRAPSSGPKYTLSVQPIG